MSLDNNDSEIRYKKVIESKNTEINALMEDNSRISVDNGNLSAKLLEMTEALCSQNEMMVDQQKQIDKLRNIYLDKSADLFVGIVQGSKNETISYDDLCENALHICKVFDDKYLHDK